MEIKSFSEKYSDKGGFEALNMMRNELRTTKYIAEHFGVTKDSVSLWMKELFDLQYDPRQLRKERIIETMIEFAKKYGEQAFRDAYYYHNKYYFDEAYQECYSRGLFQKEGKIMNEEAPDYNKIEEEAPELESETDDE